MSHSWWKLQFPVKWAHNRTKFRHLTVELYVVEQIKSWSQKTKISETGQWWNSWWWMKYQFIHFNLLVEIHRTQITLAKVTMASRFHHNTHIKISWRHSYPPACENIYSMTRMKTGLLSSETEHRLFNLFQSKIQPTDFPDSSHAAVKYSQHINFLQLKVLHS